MITSLKINKYIVEWLKAYVRFLQSEEFPLYKDVGVINETTELSLNPKIRFVNRGPQKPNNSLVFKQLDTSEDISAPIMEWKTKGLFSCNSNEKLQTIQSGSVSTGHQKYFMSIYDKVQSNSTANHEFDISYAHISGSGSSYVINNGGIVSQLLPAKSMYRKYMLECFNTTDGKMKFKNDKNGDYFYVVHFDRDSIKDRLDAGNFQITLSPISSSTNQLINTGSNTYIHPSSSVIYTLIDDSRDGKEHITYTEEIADYYYLVSGSLNQGIHGESEDDAWGMVFPKLGVMILDGVTLDQSCSFNTVTASIDGDNINKLYYSIKGSMTQNTVRTETGSWWGRSSEEYGVETYFCRVYPDEMNYSTNSTYISGSNREIKYLTMINEPQSYISSIGLYNKQKELLAIGKLEKPINKKHNTECTFQVRVRLN